MLVPILLMRADAMFFGVSPLSLALAFHFPQHQSEVWWSIEIKINVVCCVGRVEIEIEIQNGRCTANTYGIV